MVGCCRPRDCQCMVGGGRWYKQRTEQLAVNPFDRPEENGQHRLAMLKLTASEDSGQECQVYYERQMQRYADIGGVDMYCTGPDLVPAVAIAKDWRETRHDCGRSAVLSSERDARPLTCHRASVACSRATEATTGSGCCSWMSDRKPLAHLMPRYFWKQSQELSWLNGKLPSANHAS
jgi:hypothetical protein